MAVLGAALFMAQELPGSPIVPNPPPIQTTVHNDVTVHVEAPPMDPEAVSEASVTSSQAIFTTMIVPPFLQWANDLLGLPNIWTTTPDNLTYQNGPIRDLANVMRAAAFALVGLAIFAVGAGHALGQDVSFGRLIFAAVLSTGNLSLWEMGIRLNNGLTAALQGPDLPSMLRAHLVTTIDPGAAVGTVALILVYAIVALLLLFNLMFRLGLIDVLIAVGSLALLMYATPQTEHLASHYARLSVGILFSQVLIVLGLRVASVLGSLGNGGVVDTLLGIVVLILVRLLPQMMISGAGSGSRQGSGWGAAALMMVRRRVGL